MRGANKADYGFVIGEDADHVGAPLYLAVQPFQGVGAGDLGPVFVWERHVSQHVVARGVHQGAELRLLLAERVGHDAPLLLGLMRGLVPSHYARPHTKCLTVPRSRPRMGR